MGTPKQWLDDARRIGTFTPPGAMPGVAAAPAVPYDPFDDVERRKRAQQAAAEMEAMEDEMREERELRQLKKQAQRVQYMKQIEHLSGGAQSNTQAELFREMMRELQEEKRAMLDEIRALRQEATGNVGRVIGEQMQGLQKQVEQIALARQSDPDPIGSIVKNMRAITEVRNALDDAMPSPKAVETQSARERMEQLRIDKEYELRKMEADATIEAARAQREAAHADRALKQHRMERASQLVENTVGPLLAHIGGDKIAGMMGGAEAGAAAAAGAVMLPFRCPNPECNMVGHAAEGATMAQCEHCGAEFPLRAMTAEEQAMQMGPDEVAP